MMLLGYSIAFVSRLFAILSTLVAGVVSLKIYSHYLTPDVYGVVIVGLNLLNYLPYLDGGFRTILNRALLIENEKKEDKAELIAFGQILYVRVGLIVLPLALLGMLVFSMMPNAASAGLPLPFFLALGAAAAVGVFANAQTGLLLGLNAQAGMFCIRGVSALVVLGTLWLFMEQGMGVWSFPASTAAGLLFALPVSIWQIRRISPKTKFFTFTSGPRFMKHLRRFWPDAFACFRMEIATVVLYTMDLVLVLFLFGPAAAGAYGIAKRLFTMVQSLIQTSSEVAWPYIARTGKAGSGMSTALVNINAWIYGAAIGTMIAVYSPFLEWYMSDAWVAFPLVIMLLGARFLITGLASTVTYLLYGLGEFGELSKYTIRELIAAVVFECVGGYFWGVEGLCVGFLLASVFGTLFPVIRVYILKMSWSIPGYFFRMWSRAGAALLISWLSCQVGFHFLGQGVMTVAIGIAAGTLGIACGIGFSLCRGFDRKQLKTPSVALRSLMLKM